MAFAGGLMLSALVVLTCVSVSGRLLSGVLHGPTFEQTAIAQWLLGLGVGSIFGDVELTESGIAFAIFAFLPLCHISGSHAAVDIFASRFSPRVNRALQAAAGVLFAAVMVLIAVQLFQGMQSKIRSGQTTFLIEFPIWWAYALSLSGAVLAAVVAVYLGGVRLVEAATGRDILPATSGAEH
jgi:TRAP-type C4-dicarboxylate transport system permease small subunit